MKESGKKEVFDMLQAKTISIAPEKTDAFLKKMDENKATKAYWEKVRKQSESVNIRHINSLFDKGK